MRIGLVAFTGLLLVTQTTHCAVSEGRGTVEPADSTSPTVLADLPVETPEAEVPMVSGAVGDEAPFALTASDGTGMKLVSVRSDTVIESPLALTELVLEFDNPEDRQLEGHFAIALPEGASVSRFAMQIGDQWQEGEVVEKQRARQSYETFLHQRKDPALLEQGAGNQFSARVFPIAAQGRKKLVLTYAEVLDKSRPFQVRLRGLPLVQSLDVRVRFDGNEQRISEKNFVPKTDLVLDQGPTDRASGLAAGARVVLRGTVPAGVGKPDELTSALILVDTSAGRALDFDAELLAVKDLIRTMPGDARVAVAGFDQEVSLVFDGPAKTFGDEAMQKLERRSALGASDLGAAMAWAATFGPQNGLPRLVLFTDGVATSGVTGVKAMRDAAARIERAGLERTDVVAIGGLRDTQALAAIVQDGGKRSGVVTNVDDGASLIARRLSKLTVGKLAVDVPNASWQSPKTLEGLQPGDDFVVFADLKEPVSTSLTIGVGGDKLAIPIRTSQSTELVERANAVARVLELESGDPKDEETRKRIISLSTQHRILSRDTAMVVLESDSDYARFGIDRSATVDILGIESGKIVTYKGMRISLGGKAGGLAAAPSTPPSRSSSSSTGPSGWGNAVPRADPMSARGNMWGDEIGDSFGVGGLGLSGVAEGGGGRGETIGLGAVGTLGHGSGAGDGQGFGSGSGRLSGSHRSRPPQVRMGATQVSGRLPPEVIQRIVRQNFGRFRLCYENGLRIAPNLAGTVSIGFTIGRGGDVANTRVDSSTMGDTTVEQCLASSFARLTFPEPDEGTVSVVYPIVFSPEGGGSSSSVPAETAGTWAPSVPSGEKPSNESPYKGRFKTVMDSLAQKQGERALSEALHYRADSPTDVLALVSVGEAAEATGRPRLAARAYGSIIDLWSYQVEMKRFAAERLERIRTPQALAVAVNAYASANEDRLDHPSGYRLLAYAALKSGDPKRAFETVEKALKRTYPDNRFKGVLDVLRQDAGILGKAYIVADKSVESDVVKRLAAMGTQLDDEPSTRFVLSWETDANDVDLHVTDAFGEHASYRHMTLDSGGKLLADVTTGYGPEAFVIPGKAKAFPYRLSADYYSRGVMGFGMGKIQVVRHDGHGKIEIEERPFVIQTQKGSVDLGAVDEIASK